MCGRMDGCAAACGCCGNANARDAGRVLEQRLCERGRRPWLNVGDVQRLGIEPQIATGHDSLNANFDSHNLLGVLELLMTDG